MKKKVSLVLTITVAIILGTVIGQNIVYNRENKDTTTPIEETVSTEKGTNEDIKEIVMGGYNTIADYNMVIADGSVTQFVEPRYIVSEDSSGICRLDSEENVVYFKDSTGKDSLISIQYETDDTGVHRQIIYGIKLDSEDDRSAMLKLQDVFSKFVTSKNNEELLDKAFNGAISEFDGQSSSYGLKKEYKDSSLSVGVVKKLLDGRYSYQMSIDYNWKEMLNSGLEKMQEFEHIINTKSLIEEFQFGYSNIFEIELLPLIDLDSLTSKLTSYMSINSKVQSIELNFNEKGLGWISIESVINGSDGNYVKVQSQVVKSANNVVTAYVTIKAPQRKNDIKKLARTLINEFGDTYSKELKQANKKNNEYFNLKGSKNNSSIAIINKNDEVILDLSQVYNATK